jgi:hypothetical protein
MLPSRPEFERFVSVENRLLAELIVRGVIHAQWICPFGRTHIPCFSAKRFRCKCNRQNHSISLFYSSIFAKSNLSPQAILRIAYEWYQNSTAVSTAETTGHARSTVSRFYKYFRQTVSSSIAYYPDKIGGLGIRVEVDEMTLRNNGKSKKDVVILGAIEKTEQQRISIQLVQSRSSKVIASVLSKTIVPGSLLVTDFFPAYSKVALQLHCPHARINKSQSVTDPETKLNTNTIEGLWRLLRQFIRQRSGIPLPQVLAEFAWRRNNKDCLFDKFLVALGQIEWINTK